MISEGRGYRDVEVWKVAKRQQGVIATWQLARLGVSRRALSFRLQSKEWIRVLPGVVRMAWADDTLPQKLWTAYVWAGRCATLSYFTAAALNGLRPATPREIHLTLPDRFTVSGPRRWVKLHRTRSLKAFERQKCFGIPTTSPARTLVDLAAVTEEETLKSLIHHALNSHLVTEEALRAYLPRGAGRHGFRFFRKAVVGLS